MNKILGYLLTDIDISGSLRYSQRIITLLICGFFLFHSSITVALTPEQKRVIDSGARYFNVEPTPKCNPGTTTQTPGTGGAGGPIYVLGDSLTVGMRDSGQMDEKLRTAGWTPVKINGVGSKTLSWGEEQLIADKDIVATADTILIGLGTNNLAEAVSSGTTARPTGPAELEAMIREVISAAKAARPGIRIFWTNTYGEGMYNDRDLPTGMAIINAAIQKIATEEGASVIPWATSTVAQEYIVNNEVHPFGGYPEMADFIIEQMGIIGQGGSSGSSQCCAVGGAPGGSNKARVFNFFLSKGLTDFQAAGVIGNMVRESPGVKEGDGPIEPMQLQNNFETKVSSQEAITIAVPGSSLGWGIVQWTPGTKIMQPSRDAGISFDEIDTLDYQLQFLWEQLTGTGLGGQVANEKSAGDKLLLTTTIEEAAISFGHDYERFGGSDDLSNPAYANRIDSAIKALDELSGGTTVTAGSSCGYGAGVNGWDLPGEGPNPMAYYSQMREGSAPEDPAVQGYYGEFPYGEGDIAGCGCGPTSWAMIVTTLTGSKVEPPEVANWADNNGFRVNGEDCAGSSWWWSDNATMSEDRWGVRASPIDLSEAADALRSGKLIIASVGEGSPLLSNGGSGHLLVMRAFTADGKYLFADPSDSIGKRQSGGDSGDAKLFSELGSSRTPLDAAQVQNGLKRLFVVEKI